MLVRRNGLLASGLMTGLIMLGACNSTSVPDSDDSVSVVPSAEEDGEEFAYDSKVKVGKLIAETR
ncbi:MAG TPA: hypothetical protein DCG58_09700, partial [Hyphomonas adhaerens]|nr:hypothetical protein [Hyphomonas adhaerens]